MSTVTLKNIGLAERRVVSLLLDDVLIGNRSNAAKVKQLRRQLDLRGMRHDIDELLEDQKKMLLDEGVDPSLLAQGLVGGVSWDELLDAGYSIDGLAYGQEYKVDLVAATFLRELRDERKHWAWQLKPDGTKGDPASVANAQLEAIANLDEALGALDQKEEKEQ